MLNLTSLDGRDPVQDTLGDVTQTLRAGGDDNITPLITNLVNGRDDGGRTGTKDLDQCTILLGLDEVRHHELSLRDNKFFGKAGDRCLAGSVFSCELESAKRITLLVRVSGFSGVARRMMRKCAYESRVTPGRTTSSKGGVTSSTAKNVHFQYFGFGSIA